MTKFKRKKPQHIDGADLLAEVRKRRPHEKYVRVSDIQEHDYEFARAVENGVQRRLTKEEKFLLFIAPAIADPEDWERLAREFQTLNVVLLAPSAD